jgi:hypothetical protein
MSRRVYVVEWVDRDGRVYRTAPVGPAEFTNEWLKAGVRHGLEAMCKPKLRELVETDDGLLAEP